MGTPDSTNSGPNATPPRGTPGKGGTHVFQAPTGTRDFYPAELNRLRYVQEAWRRTSINHGFDEIDGPTFEHLELYTAKSGDGIVSELFSFERFGGEKTFALRPEFTPTLARMYASKAASLPRPTKWFWMQNCYRAERPQRGRLREFCQWNCDIIGDDSAAADAEVIACCVGMFEALGLRPQDVQVRIGSRPIVSSILTYLGVREQDMTAALVLLDRREKSDAAELAKKAESLGFSISNFDVETQEIEAKFAMGVSSGGLAGDAATLKYDLEPLRMLRAVLTQSGIGEWCKFDLSIARGLAYYTGMVFEVHEASGAERAIAGGGRYDKLIEMFGGPPTPAVGFGMGDVVLSLVLQDKGLLPKDEDVAGKLGLHPDALVISNGTPEADAAVAGVIASLRRGGLHVRRTYKTTKNVGKLIQDAAKLRARFCVILESAERAQVKNMGTQEQVECGVGELVARLAR